MGRKDFWWFMGKREPGVIRKCFSGKWWKKLERREKMHPPLNWNLSSHCLPVLMLALTICGRQQPQRMVVQAPGMIAGRNRERPIYVGEGLQPESGVQGPVCQGKQWQHPPPAMKTLMESIHSGSFTEAGTIKTAPTSHCHMGKATSFPSWGHLQCVHPLTHPNGAWAI